MNLPLSIMTDFMPTELGYTKLTLDRLHKAREDAAFIANLRARADTQFCVFIDDMPVCVRDDEACQVLWSHQEAECFGDFVTEIFLGLDDSLDGFRTPFFARRLALDAKSFEEILPKFSKHLARNITVMNLRSLVAGALVAPDIGSLLGFAKSLLWWHQRHGFCAACGAPTVIASAGLKRVCAACATEHFPRVDPVVIMLIHRGDFCLLGRSKRFASAVYSCLAGFLEPGETLEAAVRREVFEEAGIGVGKVAYQYCQPWPFPSSLMLGCMGEALTSEIMIDPEELEDARWLSRDELRLMLEGRHPDGLTCPPPSAIATQLLRQFAGLGS